MELSVIKSRESATHAKDTKQDVFSISQFDELRITKEKIQLKQRLEPRFR